MMPFMGCEERDRLTALFLAAVENIQDIATSAGVTAASPLWKKVTEDSRSASQAALDALNRHRREHEC
jgi:hypothetical protein